MTESIMIFTKDGKGKKVDPDEFRTMGREAKGIKAITLNEGDEVVAVIPLDYEKVIE